MASTEASNSSSPSLQERDPIPVSPSEERLIEQEQDQRLATRSIARQGQDVDVERGKGKGPAGVTQEGSSSAPAGSDLNDDGSKTRRWPRLTVSRLGRWARGPVPPEPQRISPFFPGFQSAPDRLVRRFLPRAIHKAAVLATLLFLWLLSIVLLLQSHSAAAAQVQAQAGRQLKGYGIPLEIGCQEHFWNGAHECGIEGSDCRPFTNAFFSFRCPPRCVEQYLRNDSDALASSTRPLVAGNIEIRTDLRVIGGPSTNESEPIYRADSSICQAAIHAGAIDDEQGGCGVVLLRGGRPFFIASHSNGVPSYGFDAAFPKSYTFLPEVSAADCSIGHGEGLIDMRWPLLAVSVVFTTIISIFSSSPAVFFPLVFTILFLHVGLISDPPLHRSWLHDPPPLDYYPALVSLVAGRFLPAGFTIAVFYPFAIRRQLQNLAAPFEKTVLWLGAAWVGSLDNYTFDAAIPIARLTPRDVSESGAQGIIALVLIVVALLLIALGQVHYFRLEGRLPRFLALYSVLVAFLLVCTAQPWLHLRIHHYFLAMFFLPGTSLQTRPSMIYQGLLIGLFVNGTARWGFDSILQTSAELFSARPDNGSGDLDLLPHIAATIVNVASFSAIIRLSWPSSVPSPFDGVSVVVNDVERLRWHVGDGTNASFTWGRSRDQSGGSGRLHARGNEDNELPVSVSTASQDFFRFAFLRGRDVGNYTKASIWESDGSWTPSADIDEEPNSSRPLVVQQR